MFRFLFLISFCTLHAAPYHILMHLHQDNIERCIECYKAEKQRTDKDDFGVLEEIGEHLLSQGIRSEDPEIALMSIYGAKISNTQTTLSFAEHAIRAKNPTIQLAAIELLGRIQEDEAEHVLTYASHSPYLPIRMEAAHQLSLKKSRLATGYLVSIMNHLPPQFKSFFPQLLALIGNREATTILKTLITDPELSVRLSAYLSAANFYRDDFLPTLRAAITHRNPAEQEAAAFALGALSDSHSIPDLKKLNESSNEVVRLAAARALIALGDQEAKTVILDRAKRKDLNALILLAEMEEGKEILGRLLFDSDTAVRYHAALALLEHKDPRAAPILMDMLIVDETEIGFLPIYSPGGSLIQWRIVPSAYHYSMKTKRDIVSFSQNFREMILIRSLDLTAPVFLRMAEHIIAMEQHALIPTAMHLLENLGTPEALSLLKRCTQKLGSPFTRAYANLTLYRMDKDPRAEKELFEWIKHNRGDDLIRFRNLLTWTEREDTPFDLTPEETSLLLIESYQTLADKHDLKSIDLLLDAIAYGNPKNRYALAGLLLHAVQ